MEVFVSTFHEHTIITIEGDVNIYNVRTLKDTIEKLMDGSVLNMIVDMKAVNAIDSTGLGALYMGKRKMEALKGYYALANVNQAIASLLGIAQMDFRIIEFDEGIVTGEDDE